jgi:hypothetical protein
MSDIEQLLRQTARSCEVTPSPDVVEADILRGRTAWRRRRRQRAVWSSVGSTLAAAVVVGTAIVVGGIGGSDGAGEGPAARPETAPAQGPKSGVSLVAYVGEQPRGFIVDRVPEGWKVQEDPDIGVRYHLTIAPQGDTTPAGSFAGKLVVMLQSKSVGPGLPKAGDPVEVNGRPGMVRDSGSADTLTYDYGDGIYVDVQAWQNLGWTNEQLVSFAEGVTVTPDALAGRG